jgi:hypothetical protein
MGGQGSADADQSAAVKRVLWLLVLAAICALAFIARCWNLRDVFIEGRIYFIDADCYSRMTRAAQVAEGRALVVKHHDFENWPAGITPHTTAPMDWLIVTGKWIADHALPVADSSGTSVLRGQTLDLAGALISPLLGVLACAFLACWAQAVAPPGTSLVVALFFAVSPILVHGTALGRPDHQSLLLLLLAVALSAELALGKALTNAWGSIAAVAWALALWVSLYEPLVLFAAVAIIWTIADRRRFHAPEMRASWIAFAAILATSFLIEGWRIGWPDTAMRRSFENWQAMIGELAHLDVRSPVLYGWLTLAILPAPLLLYLAGRLDRRAWAVGMLLVVTFSLTLWQVRWGYFLALIFALCLPWLIAAIPRRWIAYTLLFFSLWPMARDWDDRLHPSFEQEKQSALQRRELTSLRQVAEEIRGAERAPFLAPWWLSPALAYWSGQPGVAGSSHESLPGTVASARFFLAEKSEDAAAILKARGVRWVLADEASRVIGTSAALLGIELPATPLALTLFDHPQNAPAFLRERVQGSSSQLTGPTFYRLYRVEDDRLPP